MRLDGLDVDHGLIVRVLRVDGITCTGSIELYDLRILCLTGIPIYLSYNIRQDAQGV